MKKWLNILLVSIVLISATTMTAFADFLQDELNASVSLTSDGKQVSELTWITVDKDVINLFGEAGGLPYGFRLTISEVAVLNNNASLTVKYNGTDTGKYLFMHYIKYTEEVLELSYADMANYSIAFCYGRNYINYGDAYVLTAVNDGECEWTHHEDRLEVLDAEFADNYMEDKFRLFAGESVTFTLPEVDPDAYYLLYIVMVNPQTDEIATKYIALDFDEQKNTEVTPATPFADVPADAYYTEAVKWAYENGITTGTSETTFGPTETCTRGQVVTFLWRAKGCPEPTSTVNPFTDVKETDYFYKAVLWAVENGITNGMTETTFGPKETCTSGHVVTFLWRADGQPAAVAESTLVESGKWYSDAVAWADSVGLLSGTGIAFAVSNNAPRADIVTYLYRDIAV